MRLLHRARILLAGGLLAAVAAAAGLVAMTAAGRGADAAGEVQVVSEAQLCGPRASEEPPAGVPADCAWQSVPLARL